VPGDYVRNRAPRGVHCLTAEIRRRHGVFHRKAATRVIPSGLRGQRKEILMQMGLKPDGKDLQFAGDFARRSSGLVLRTVLVHLLNSLRLDTPCVTGQCGVSRLCWVSSDRRGETR
jgi:hypothetical protein